jgi:hypothetical protein
MDKKYSQKLTMVYYILIQCILKHSNELQIWVSICVKLDLHITKIIFDIFDIYSIVEYVNLWTELTLVYSFLQGQICNSLECFKIHWLV